MERVKFKFIEVHNQIIYFIKKNTNAVYLKDMNFFFRLCVEVGHLHKTRVLKTITVGKRQQVTGGSTKWHEQKLHDFCTLPNASDTKTAIFCLMSICHSVDG
jgi:hypothetical protein